MAKAVFISPDGASSREIEVRIGQSIRDAAIQASVPGILGDCGGFANCGTCHVYVDEAWLDRLPPVSEIEGGMLEGVACPAQPNSRLSCQLPMTPELDGIVLRLPESQI